MRSQGHQDQLEMPAIPRDELSVPSASSPSMPFETSEFFGPRGKVFPDQWVACCFLSVDEGFPVRLTPWPGGLLSARQLSAMSESDRLFWWFKGWSSHGSSGNPCHFAQLERLDQIAAAFDNWRM